MVAEDMLLVERVWEALKTVPDPEIPVVSIFDLGMVEGVILEEDGRLNITLIPTFSGCPATEMIAQMVMEKCHTLGIEKVKVAWNFHHAYTTDRITLNGRNGLKSWGIAPPSLTATLTDDLDLLETVTCPKCGTDNTEMKSIFGPALCRTMHYCFTCQEAFQGFKSL